MSDVYDRSALEGALSQLESTAYNFAHRFIIDGKVRSSYINQTSKLAQEYRGRVTRGELTPGQAAQQVNLLRNEILDAQRLQSSDIGKAKAVSLKKEGLTLKDLTEKYAQKKFGKPFGGLGSAQQNQVYLEIIDSAGRQRPSVNAAAGRLSALGRGLIVVSLGVAIYNVATADDKGTAAAREGVILGGGFAGGAAGGAVAGLACGPGAPVCVTVGVLVGGALGALGADMSFGWIFE